jgi:hypothetical protein
MCIEGKRGIHVELSFPVLSEKETLLIDECLEGLAFPIFRDWWNQFLLERSC